MLLRSAKFEDSLSFIGKRNDSLSPDSAWLSPCSNKKGNTPGYQGYTYDDLCDEMA